MKYRVLQIISTALMVLPMAVSAFSVPEEEDLIRAYGDEDFISIATGSRQLISQAPAVASVITAEDIRAMGATDLDEVLETVPGLHVSRSPRAYSPLYTMRGIYSENNPQVLVLINDIPITNVYVGDRSQVWAGMPINNISRIEVIRGPGSAIYGADAFAGTINIITKTQEDIRGTEAGVRTGSFNSHEGWILHGSSWNDFDISLSVEFQKTDGHDRIIEADYQTLFDDNLPFPAASIAPDSVNLDRKLIETRADIRRGDWRFRLGYQGRKDVGTGAGVAYALDPTGSGDSDRFNADLTYSTLLSQNWDFTGQLSYLDTSAETNLVLYPPGAFGFPEGVIGSPHVYERHTRLGLSSFYHGFDKHRLRIGVGAIHNDMYKIREFKNFEGPFSPLPGFEVQDVSNDPDEVFIDPHDRKVFYAFIQDEWDIAYNWRLTSGLRYDNYSDFGDTVNPRLALVWQTTPDLTTKVLYGRAFRAPAFNELYNNPNNPVARGNPDLKPETIDTYELAFNYQATPDLNTSLNLFHYRMSDIIRFSPDTGEAENFGKIEGRGLELEARYDVTPRFRVLGNYAIQESTDQETDAKTANAPQHMVYMRANWAFIDNWSLNTQLNWISDRKRSPEDSRDAIDDYLVTDLTLRYRAFTSPWEFALSGRNIFDADAREPSPRLSPAGPVPPGEALIPNDLPLAGRHFFVEARYHFD